MRPPADAQRPEGGHHRASAQLVHLESLVTAKEWTRAAIVYAFTEPDRGNGGRREAPRSGSLSLKAFAALGIAGLRSDTTVGKYHAAWQHAIDVGKANRVEPGDRVTEPSSGVSHRGSR